MTTATKTPQHLSALARASEVYQGHCALKRDVRGGTLSVVDAIADPRSAGSLTIGKLIGAQNRWGPRRTTRFLNKLGIFEGRRVDALTERQKRLIEAALNRG